MPEPRTLIAVGAAVATFAVGAVVASGMSPSSSASRINPPDGRSTSLPEVGDYANAWHLQTAVASYQSRVLRYAQQAPTFTGARLAVDSGYLILYGAGPPPDLVRTMLAAPPFGAHATWVRVPYSRRELDRAVSGLRQAMPDGSVVEYAPNYSGVLVGLRPLPTSPARQSTLYQRAQRVTDIPVTFLRAGVVDPM
jgi:hypothetical protein